MIELLDAARDRERWLGIWRETGREPFAHPGYCEAVSTPSDRAVAAQIRYDDGVALVPLNIRTLTLPHGVITDCASPYGYGGPFFAGKPRPEVVFAVLRSWLASEGVACAFLRLSIGAVTTEGEVAPGCRVVAASKNVVVDLTRSAAEQWTRYDHKVRKNVKKAERLGCRVIIDPEFTDVGGFSTVYAETMVRRAAAPWFHFSNEFFYQLRAELSGQLAAVHVTDDAGRVVSTELILHSNRRLYSFLGGTLRDALPLAPNDLLKHAVIEYGRATGRREYVLGGGLTPDDGIFRYKLAFDRDGVRPYLTARIIGDTSSYCAAAGTASLAEAYESTALAYFPPYRGAERAAPTPKESA